MVKVGHRFHPTDKELMNYYLMNKIVGKTKLVEETIGEINFYDYDPVSLPSLSKNQSDNGIYYFFAPKQYTNSSKSSRKRSSKYGKWKLSGGVTEIKDKSGEMIGDKQVLVYEYKNVDPKAKGIKSPWVMHEYQITHSKYHNLGTYVICKLFDKREDQSHVTYGNNNWSEPTHHPQVSDSKISPVPKVDEQPGQDIDSLFRNDFIIPMNIDQEDLSQWDYKLPRDNNISNVQLQTPYYLSQADDEFLGGLKHVDRGQAEHLFYDQDFTMQETYRPTNPVRLEQPYHENNYGMSVNDFTTPEDHYGFDPNIQLQTSYLSQGYAESISAMSYQTTWSPVDSVGSSYIHFPSCSTSEKEE